MQIIQNGFLLQGFHQQIKNMTKEMGFQSKSFPIVSAIINSECSKCYKSTATWAVHPDSTPTGAFGAFRSESPVWKK